jgi:hypothetical protein
MKYHNQGITNDDSPSKKTSLKERLDKYSPLFVLILIASAFSAGVGTYRLGLEITNQETVIKGSCIPKADLVGPILKTEAVREIDHLIDTGQSLGKDEAQTRVWLMQVLAFIHTLNLEKDYEWLENAHAPVQKVPAVEADVRYALSDPSVEIQAQKTLGVLKGFRAGLEAQASYP